MIDWNIFNNDAKVSAVNSFTFYITTFTTAIIYLFIYLWLISECSALCIPNFLKFRWA